jgi:Na+/H+-translocating membrane pyrophosphatase
LVASNAFYFPLVISACGIFVGILTSFISTWIYNVDEPEKVERSLKMQLIFSTILMTPFLYGAS